MVKINYNPAVLGELEAAIMEIVWRLESASVRQVLTELRKRRRVAYTTVMTVMSRLAEKAILKRQLDSSGAYIYVPALSKEKFFAAVSQKAIHSLVRQYGTIAVAQFIDVIEASDAKEVAQWRKKLKRIR